MRCTILLLLGMGCVEGVMPAPAEPPRVVYASPDHGETDVDPALALIRVVFDQDMQNGRSVCGGGATFPKVTAQPRWESARELVIPVALEAGHRYDMSINCPAFGNFRSATGEACEITPISFMTAAVGGLPPAPAPLTPEANAAALSALLNAIDRRYSYRDRLVKDWPDRFEPHRAAILGAQTPAGFARAVSRPLGAARDAHLVLAVNHALFPTLSGRARVNADGAALAKLVPRFEQAGPTVAVGVFDDGIAYVQINGWPSEGALLQPAHEFLTEHAGAPGVVIDVRMNGGGDELAARRFAGRFASERSVYSRHRVRDASREGGWTVVSDRVISPEDAVAPGTGAALSRCRAPVTVLIGPACMSSNESFVLMMKHGAGATLIGGRTFGSSGNPRPVDLGNGVVARVPSWEDLFPDGTVLEGLGVEPDIAVEFKGAGRDEVLEGALEHLRRSAR